MNDPLKILLSLSLSGGLLALLVFAIKPIFQNKLNKRWQYYIWLVVLLRFFCPSRLGLISLKTYLPQQQVFPSTLI